MVKGRGGGDSDGGEDVGGGVVVVVKKRDREEGGWSLGRSFQAENFIPGLSHVQVLVVRQDLKMGQGKIASQCAHAATGLYSRLMQRYSIEIGNYQQLVFRTSHRNLLHRWEHGGQAKIVVTCKNQQEMNKLQEVAEGIGLPTYVVADAGRTQVSAGSRTVLAIGPGNKSTVDSVTGKQRLL
ncbi:peptidyl-tRNA hydrolase 2, mitochondrial isoform X1 [Tanacetum coccineum]